MSTDSGGAVIDLAAHRVVRTQPQAGALCACGSGWFELRAGGKPGAVCMEANGVISGYAGGPYCIECGTPWRPGPVTTGH
ncbi:hypothetical protein ABZV65_30940 [Streptomyces bauhiniae]|uniref:hypothetical protein n=1 Tax=Streptomyces bauhiniae TaxID=2340725 RepID=UPI0033A29C8B